MSKDLLLEIGTEEVPAHVMPGILKQLQEKAEAAFKENRLVYENVRTIGTRADGKKWVIPIENPDYRDGDTNAEQYAVVTNLDGKSLVTSGDYERYYTVNGVRYSHLIDPDTLYPGTYHRSVSILTSDSGLADALSTGLFLMSVEDGKACLSKLNADRPQEDQIEACWIDADGTMTYTDGFKDYIEK